MVRGLAVGLLVLGNVREASECLQRAVALNHSNERAVGLLEKVGALASRADGTER